VKDRYSIFVGLAFVALVLIATFNTLGDEESGTLGIDNVERRWPLPEFAVPAAAGQLEGDANVAQDDCETSQVPCPGDARRTPACGIETPGAIRVCDFFGRPLVISFWFTEGDCVAQQDVVDAVAERYRGRVGFLSLDVRGDRDTLRDLLREHGWQMPVGFDRDGAVASLYGVGGCPTFAYVYPGGTLQDASIGILDAAGLAARVERLLGATREAEGA
jgi:hypothetical protein